MRVKCTDTSRGARAIISTSTVGLPGGTRKPMRTGLLRGSTLALRLGAKLLQHAGDFVDSGLDASLVLLLARRAGGAGRADGLLADLDRQRALVRDHVVEVDQAELRVGLEPLHHLAGRDAEGARGIGLAKAVLHGVRARAVAAHLGQHFGVAPDHGHGYRVATGLAGLQRGLRDGQRRSEEHTSELQSQSNLVCRLLLEKKKRNITMKCSSYTKTFKHSTLSIKIAPLSITDCTDVRHTTPH